MNKFNTSQLSNLLDEILSEIEKYNISLPDRKAILAIKPPNVVYIDVTARLKSHLSLLQMLFYSG